MSKTKQLIEEASHLLQFAIKSLIKEQLIEERNKRNSS